MYTLPSELARKDVIRLLDVPGIRNPIIAGLYGKLQRPVIRSDQAGDIPDYPYVAYSITSPYIDSYGHDSERIFTAEGVTSIEQTKNIEMVFSFTAYADDEDKASALCMKAIEHFNREARDDLRAAGIVLVSNTDVQNRSLLLVEHYERRMGVDFRFRVVDRSQRSIDYIDQAQITKA